MQILSFNARRVHGYLNFDVDFSRNPTILTGPNGSGKTTALRMMQALLHPSLRDLLFVQFAEATIAVGDNSGIAVVSAKKSKDTLFLSVSNESRVLELPRSVLESIEPEHGDSRRVAESIRILKVKYSDHPTYRAISRLQSPAFLGLDRRNVGFQDETNFEQDDISVMDYSFRSSSRIVRGSLAAGLLETQALVRDAFRRVRRVKDQQSDRLRRKLLLTGFRYAEVSKEKHLDQLKIDAHYVSEENLAKQKLALVRALLSVGIDESESRKELDPYFDRVISLSKRLRKTDQVDADVMTEAFFEALLNQSNLMRLKELVETVRDFDAKSDQLSSRFKDFVACMNRFFADSRKSIEIDPVGQIRVNRPDGTEVPLEALSSGERQLLVMFGHVYFNSFGSRSNVFVIDEPELSLHLRWQEMLLQEMLDSNSRAQFIVATHSPEIVGELTSNCVAV